MTALEVATRPITVSVLWAGERPLTRTLYEQLPPGELFERLDDDGTPGMGRPMGTIWGWVNLCPDQCRARNASAHIHVIGERDGGLFVDVVARWAADQAGFEAEQLFIGG